MNNRSLLLLLAHVVSGTELGLGHVAFTSSFAILIGVVVTSHVHAVFTFSTAHHLGHLLRVVASVGHHLFHGHTVAEIVSDGFLIGGGEVLDESHAFLTLLEELGIFGFGFISLGVFINLGHGESLEAVEHGVSLDSLGDGTGLTSLLVLLLLLNLLLGEIFTILPVDDGRCDLSDLFTFGVLERTSEGELGVGDEFVLTEGEGDGLGALDISFRVHDLGYGELGNALEDFSVFLLDNSHKHLVVLDSLEPEVRDTVNIFEVVNFDGFVGSVSFVNLSLLFSGVLDLSGLGFEHRDGFVEGLDISSEVSSFSKDDLLTGGEEGFLSEGESSLKFFHLSVHLVSNAGAVVGDHVHSLESVLDFSGHAFNDLDHLLVHFTLIVVSWEVFPRS